MHPTCVGPHHDLKRVGSWSPPSFISSRRELDWRFIAMETITVSAGFAHGGACAWTVPNQSDGLSAVKTTRGTMCEIIITESLTSTGVMLRLLLTGPPTPTIRASISPRQGATTRMRGCRSTCFRPMLTGTRQLRPLGWQMEWPPLPYALRSLSSATTPTPRTSQVCVYGLYVIQQANNPC